MKKLRIREMQKKAMQKSIDTQFDKGFNQIKISINPYNKNHHENESLQASQSLDMKEKDEDFNQDN